MRLDVPQQIPATLLGALAIGGGLRLGKNLIDLVRGSPTDPVGGSIPALKARLARVPVEVSEDEAEELRRKGINVKSAGWIPPSLLAGAGHGAAAAAGGLAGWKLIDYLVDRYRKSSIKSDIQDTKDRIQKLLAESPTEQDVPLANQMKAAEDAYIAEVKTASPLLGGLGAAAGATGVLALLAAYQKTKRESKARGRIGALAEALRMRRRLPAKATMEPFVRANKKEDQEERPALNQVPTALDEPASLAVTPY